MSDDRMEEIKKHITGSDMILIGIGEEFDECRKMRENPLYLSGKTALLGSEKYSFLFPLWQEVFTPADWAKESEIGLNKLAEALRDKDYFVVSTSVGSAVKKAGFLGERVVAPCGGADVTICSAGCANHLSPTPAAEQFREQMNLFVTHLKENGISTVDEGMADAFFPGVTCEKCGETIGLNNIYCGQYDEQGYLPDWEKYTKWLQSTLNKNLCVIELGVGMKFPSVIRFPFEKIVFFNKKAVFYRIHENLYQLTEELAGKGSGIQKNAIDWLQNL